jgi:aspartyl-tRNA(Asn)/glutamyl-tRNA(Gln) amidotransferase subunit A
MTSLADLTIAELRDLLRCRQTSVVDVVRAVLERLAATEPSIHSYAHVWPDDAHQAAVRADRRLAAGQLDPLHGVPFAAKDVFWTEGRPSEAGSRVHAGFHPREDAVAVQRMRAAGAILLGKHVTHELATDPALTSARCAWDPSRYSGGSSAGAGSSVAAGSSTVALGTDAGGSVRKPASLNNVVGLKPTYGWVSRHGVIAPSGSLDAVGLVTRTVQDNAQVFSAMSGIDDERREAAARRLTGIRLGVSPFFFGAELDDAVRARIADALVVLRGLGAEVVTVATPALRLAVGTTATLAAVEASASQHRQLQQDPAEYRPSTLQALAAGLLIPAAHLDAAQRARRAISAQLSQVFAVHRLHALVGPTLPRPAIPAEEAVGQYLEAYVTYTTPANLSGRPALSVPCGFTPDELPVGLQLIGRHHDEDTLFTIAAAYHAEVAWSPTSPPVVRELATSPSNGGPRHDPLS